VGHSFGRMFGRRSSGHDSRLGKVSASRGEEAALAGAAMIHGKVVVLPGPAGTMALVRPPALPAPSRFFPGVALRVAMPMNQQFVSGSCGSLAFSWHNFLFPGDLDCFVGDPFLFNPFLGGGFVPGHFRTNSVVTASGWAAPSAAADSSQALEAAGTASGHGSSSTSAGTEARVTLLQLRDGSMYGLTRYWVEDGRLHYLTDYGGENSVPLDRIDIVGTAKLNAGRGTSLVLPVAAPPQ
jgi:hypothetical protein